MTVYTGNEKLVPLTQQQAEEYKALSTFGVSYNRHDLSNYMLSLKGAVGTRLYPAIHNQVNTTIAVAVKTDMGEIEGPGPNYLRSNGNSIAIQATRLYRNDTKWYLKYTKEDKGHYHVYFSQLKINEILDNTTQNILGIRFYDTVYQGKSTMMMVGVYLNEGGNLVDMQGNGAYILSDLPCPDDCPPSAIGDLYTNPPT